jgi:uncharacterized membrane protein (DUF485 family)
MGDRAEVVAEADLRWRGTVSLVFSLVAILPSLLYIVVLPLAPELLSRSLGESRVTVGIALGLGLAAWLVVLALVYTYYVNSHDRSDGPVDA